MHWVKIASNECHTCLAYVPDNDILSHIANQHCHAYLYLCGFCFNYSGSRKTDLFQHLRDKHYVNKFSSSCPICMRFQAYSDAALFSHIQRCHFDEVYIFKCQYCNFVTPNKNYGHIVNNHYACTFKACNVVTLDPFNLFDHYLCYHFPTFLQLYSCKECDYTSQSSRSLKQHQRAKHEIYDYDSSDIIIQITCHICYSEFQSRQVFTEHIEDEHPYFFYNCPFHCCSYESTRFWSLTQHYTDKHLCCKKFYYACPECDYESMREKSLKQHLFDKHGIEKVCTLCTSYEEDLIDHLNYDHSQFSEYYSCLICNVECDDYYELDNHLILHNITIPYELRVLC